MNSSSNDLPSGPSLHHRGSRLTPLDHSKELLPWRHANQFHGCFLYWMPVSSYPIPPVERRWLLTFFIEFAKRLETGHQLVGDIFVMAKTIQEDPYLKREFINNSMEFRPLLGYARIPNTTVPAMEISPEKLEDLKKGERTPEPYDFYPDYCYWLVNRMGETQRQFFFGYGGMTILFMKPDPKTQPSPELISALQGGKKMKMLQPLFQKFDLEKIVASSSLLHGDFRPHSKAVFGAGMEQDLHFKGLPYIIPMLKSDDFFEAIPETLSSWFEIFDVYVRESPADKGLVLASKFSLEENLIEIIREMTSQKLIYPEQLYPDLGE